MIVQTYFFMMYLQTEVLTSYRLYPILHLKLRLRERKAQWGQEYLKNKNYNVLPDSGWPPFWKEVRIPGRKKRLIEKYKDQIDNLFFYVFNFEYDKAWKIKATQMTDDVNHRPDFARVHKSETFYHIPYEEAELVTL